MYELTAKYITDGMRAMTKNQMSMSGLNNEIMLSFAKKTYSNARNDCFETFCARYLDT